MKYRFLGEGERLEAGDEYHPSIVMGWYPTEKSSGTVSFMAALEQRYRRKVEGGEESGGGR